MAGSEKNQFLSNRSEEFQRIQADHVEDSIRLGQLRKEMLQPLVFNRSEQKLLINEYNPILKRDSIRFPFFRRKVDSIRSLVSGFPVILSPDTLFYIYVKMGSFTPMERADALNKRLLNLAKDYFFKAPIKTYYSSLRRI